MRKRTLCLVLCLCVALACFPASSLALEIWEEPAVSVSQPPVKNQYGFFPFPSSFSASGEISCYYHYDESWFSENSFTYQHNLAKLSLRAAVASFGGGETGVSAENIRFLMSGLSFQNIATHYPVPGDNTIGYAIGMKNIRDSTGGAYTLLLVTVRGGGYYDEWAGSFNVGPGETHAGFQLAAQAVTDGIRQYREDHAAGFQDTVKVWLTGYSRGAAVANLTAKSLDDGTVLENLRSENVFAYCFGCPQTSRDPEARHARYGNIINIVNPIDMVPKVVMSKWGFTRYGRTLYLPCREATPSAAYALLASQMMESCRDFLLFTDTHAEEILPLTLCQSVITDNLMDLLALDVQNQETYCRDYQQRFMETARNVFGIGGAGLTAGNLLRIGGLFPENAAFLSALLGWGNLSDIALAHSPELYLAWLDSLQGEADFSLAAYRIAYISGAVNVEVRDSENALVSAVTDGAVEDVENSLAAYVDENGQVVLALPMEEAYTLRLTVAEPGPVTYTVTEYSMDSASATKQTSWEQSAAAAGEQFIETLGKIHLAGQGTAGK